MTPAKGRKIDKFFDVYELTFNPSEARRASGMSYEEYATVKQSSEFVQRKREIDESKRDEITARMILEPSSIGERKLALEILGGVSRGKPASKHSGSMDADQKREMIEKRKESIGG